VTIEKDGKRITIRTAVSGQVSCVLRPRERSRRHNRVSEVAMSSNDAGFWEHLVFPITAVVRKERLSYCKLAFAETLAVKVHREDESFALILITLERFEPRLDAGELASP
jgi:hypothetical protein